MFFDIFAFAVFGILFLAIVIAIVGLGSLPGDIAVYKAFGSFQMPVALCCVAWLNP